MARMHSRRKGKSKSIRPVNLEASVPSMDKDELELLIKKLAKEGKTSAQIGLILRDSYGIPDVPFVLQKRIATFLKEQKLLGEFPEDLQALMKKVFELRKHFESNKQDTTAKRGIQLTDSKINRLVKYYKENNVLAADFKYRPSDLNLYLQ